MCEHDFQHTKFTEYKCVKCDQCEHNAERGHSESIFYTRFLAIEYHYNTCGDCYVWLGIDQWSIYSPIWDGFKELIQEHFVLKYLDRMVAYLLDYDENADLPWKAPERHYNLNSSLRTNLLDNWYHGRLESIKNIILHPYLTGWYDGLGKGMEWERHHPGHCSGCPEKKKSNE